MDIFNIISLLGGLAMEDNLLDAMKENPGKIKMSYTGPGGSGHIQALLLNRYGYEPALTAYNSGAEGVTAVMGHQVDFTNSNYSTVASYIESGDLKLLEHEAARWLSADELWDVKWLPSDIKVVNKSILVSKGVADAASFMHIILKKRNI